MAKITRNSKLTFGRCKGKKLSLCETSYLEWMVAKLMDSDLCEWAQAARAELAARTQEDRPDQRSLKEQADQILRDAGFKP